MIPYQGKQDEILKIRQKFDFIKKDHIFAPDQH